MPGAAGPNHRHGRRPAQGRALAAAGAGRSPVRRHASGNPGEDPRAFTTRLETVIHAL
jgi:hypothetical protein